VDQSFEIDKQSLWTKEFTVLTISNLFTFLGFQALMPTLPLYVSQLSGSSSDIGLTVGVLTVAAVIIRPFSGAASDTFDRMKVLRIGVIICLIAMSAYFWAFTIKAILFVRIIHGIGWGIATSSFGTIAGDIVPASRRGEGIGYFGFASMIAGALGPLLGIWLITSYSFRTVLIYTAISTFFSFVSLLWVQLSQREKGEVSDKPTSLFSKLIEKTSIFPSTLMGILGVVFGGVTSFITLFGDERGIDNVGWFFFLYAISSFLVRPISGKIFDKKGHIYVFIPGALSATAGVLFLSYTNSILLLATAAIFYGIGTGAIQPSLQAWINNRVAPNRRGAANSTFFTAFDLGIGIGSMMLGSIARIYNYSTMYRFSAIFMIIFIAVYMIYVFKNKTIRA
jgi:MFS family permease